MFTHPYIAARLVQSRHADLRAQAQKFRQKKQMSRARAGNTSPSGSEARPPLDLKRTLTRADHRGASPARPAR